MTKGPSYPSLQSFHAKVCYTAAGMLIHEGRVLLIRHKKLGFWLNPGGHIEPNELPHQAAEREFFEETGVRVKAEAFRSLHADEHNEYLPHPISTNLHWISKENYWARVQGGSTPIDQVWKKGCEQHLGFLFLVQPVAGVEYQRNLDETLGIGWFAPAQLAELEMPASIRGEIQYGFSFAGRV